MRRLTQQSLRWVFPLAAIFLYVAVLLRAVITYRGNAYFIWIMLVLFIWLVLAISASAVTRKIPKWFPVYLAIQTILVFVLLTAPDSPDFFAALWVILSMQTMLRLNPRFGILWIGLCAVGMVIIMFRSRGFEAVALTLPPIAGAVLLGFYALATRRSQDVRRQNQDLAQKLQEANRQLTAYSAQMEELGAARERARLARDLHDSVTQTVFSMSLTAQSAGLLFARNPSQVKVQLDRLGQLTQSALAEIKLLISELKPANTGAGGLASAVRDYIHGRVFPRDLSISINSEGRGTFLAAEEQGLFRIIQEALNNIIKHSRASQASLNLHLTEPFWIEVADQGQGFDLPRALAGSGIGLKSMYERAVEIGWHLQVFSSPGSGTRVRIEKPHPKGGKYAR
jgi:signal transduction histidine kinase